MKIRTGFTLLLLFVSVLCIETQAQEYRIYTKVYQKQGKGYVPVSRSLTLFRSGKAYDHIDAMGEVIIFDPANKEFSILNTKRDIKTTVKFDQLMQQLEVARNTTLEYAEQLSTSGEDEKIRESEKLFFQLNPQFESSVATNRRMIKLSSPGLTYQVRGIVVEPVKADSYLNYADWMSRLNYVLHPNPFLPDCRIALNQELKKYHVMPLQVDFEAELESVLKLRAEHRIQNELSKQDLTLIHTWETAIQDEGIRPLTFQEYQKSTLENQLAK